MKELEAIVREIRNVTPEAEQQLIEKCLRLVGSNKTAKEQEIGYAFLAKMASQCSSATLRTFQSRFANRFAPISDHFTFTGSLFVREVLVRNPQAGELHSVNVSRIISNTIDVATESNDTTIRALAAELFALRASSANITLLINTLDALISSDKIQNTTKDILQLSTFGITSHRFSLSTLLFECLAFSLSSVTKLGVSVNRNDIIRIIDTGIRRQETRHFAFLCLRSLCVNAKYSMIPLVGRIVSSLIGELENPDVDLIRTLEFISSTFGPITSTLYKHFYVIFTALKHPLHQQSYGPQAANLLAIIIEGSGALIKPEVFMAVQKLVCESAIRHVDCPLYLQLLASFVALNNEYVPPPLQISRSVLARTSSKCENGRRLRSLCNVAARPRVTDIANIKAMKTLSLKEKTIIENSVESNAEASKDVVSVEDDDDNDVIMIESSDGEEEEEKGKEGEEEGEDPGFTVLPTVPSVAFEIRTVTEAGSHRVKRASESTPKTPVSAKKKKVEPKQKTDLLEGEASVDDILNFFDAS